MTFGRLEGLTGKLAGEEYRIEPGETIWIGSSPDCDVILKGADIAPYHLGISLDDDEEGIWVLREAWGKITLSDGRELPQGEEVFLSTAERIYLGDGHQSFRLEIVRVEGKAEKRKQLHGIAGLAVLCLAVLGTVCLSWVPSGKGKLLRSPENTPVVKLDSSDSENETEWQDRRQGGTEQEKRSQTETGQTETSPVHSDSQKADDILRLLSGREALALSEKIKEETVQYSDGGKIYRPSYEAISYDEEQKILYYDNILMVYLMEKPTEEEREALAELVKGEVAGYTEGAMQLLQIKVPETDLTGLDSYAKQLMNSEKVLYAVFDMPVTVKASMTQDRNPWSGPGEDRERTEKGNEETPSGNDWWAEAIGAYSAWDGYSDMVQSIRIGMIDSGFNLEHEELCGKSTMLNENTPNPHGTGVAAVAAAANNAVGIRGVADQAELLCIDWAQDNEVSLLSGTEYLQLMNLAISQGAKVINMSFGQYVMTEDVLAAEYPGFSYEAYLESISSTSQQTARTGLLAMLQLYLEDQRNYLLVQAAGNGLNNGWMGINTETAGFFAAITEEVYDTVLSGISDDKRKRLKGLDYDYFDGRVIIVGAVENVRENGGYRMAQMSNFGENLDICAPGVNIYTAWGEGKDTYDTVSGTSVAAPMVSGAAAFLWSMLPQLSAPEVKRYLISNTGNRAFSVNAEDRWGPYPMLNIGQAADTVYQECVLPGRTMTAMSLKRYLNKKLIPQYGLVPTEYQKFDVSAATKADHIDISSIDGILSAKITDLDGDGAEEMLVVRFEKEGEQNTWIYLEIFEASLIDGGSLADSKSYRTTAFGDPFVDVRSAVFLSEGEDTGKPWINLYVSCSTGEENNEVLRQFLYGDKRLQSSMAAGLLSEGTSLVSSYTAATDQTSKELTVNPKTSREWQRYEIWESVFDQAESKFLHLLVNYRSLFEDNGVWRNGQRFGFELNDYESQEKYLVKDAFNRREELEMVSELDTRLERIEFTAKDIYVRDYTGLYREEKITVEESAQTEALSPDQKNGDMNADTRADEEENTEEAAADALREYLRAVLVPQYGVIRTGQLLGSISYRQNGDSSRNWSAADLTGLLSGTIRDFDSDGQEELLTVAFDTKEPDEYGSAQSDMILRMYEYEKNVGIKETAMRKMSAADSYLEEAIGYRQACVFVYEYQGGTYIGIDTYLYANESIVTLAVFQYGGSGIEYLHIPHSTTAEKSDTPVQRDGTAFDLVSAVGYQVQGYGNRYVKWIYGDAAEPLFCGWGTVDLWTEILSYAPDYQDSSGNWQMKPKLTEEELKDYMDSYLFFLEDVGLTADDERIGMSTCSGWPGEAYQERLIAAPDVYNALEGSITFLSGIYTHPRDHYQAVQLIREDYEGTLDAYR